MIKSQDAFFIIRNICQTNIGTRRLSLISLAEGLSVYEQDFDMATEAKHKVNVDSRFDLT